MQKNYKFLIRNRGKQFMDTEATKNTHTSPEKAPPENAGEVSNFLDQLTGEGIPPNRASL